MKYYLVEGELESGKYNAGSKARNDVELILSNLGYNPFEAHTSYGVQSKKWLKPLQYYKYLENYFKFKREILKLKKGDILLVQYPILNTTFFYKRILKSLDKKGVKTIALIHDLDSLRLKSSGHMSLYDRKRIYEDNVVLPLFTRIVSHNKKMSQILCDMNIPSKKIYNLEIFDYLVNSKLTTKTRRKDYPCIIAGNLSSTKAGFIKHLLNVERVKFNLYGKGLDITPTKNIDYKGSFLPDVLPNKLDGSFGLVWDGNSIDECNGVFGEYLKYNNPHKISLYLISGLPVIVWKKSAMASFVENNKIGFAVNSLNDIGKLMSKITDEEYSTILKNVKSISKNLLNGYYLKKVINNIEADL